MSKQSLKNSFAVFTVGALVASNLLIFTGTALAAPAPTWNVSVGSTGACTTSDRNCATISAAITAASTGDTIDVANGNYSEAINITKSLTITGNNESKVVVTQSAGTPFGDGITVSQAANVTISKMTFVTPAGEPVAYALHAYEDTNLTLKDLTFNGAGNTATNSGGKRFGGVDINSVDGITIKNVDVNNYSKNGFSFTAQNLSSDPITNDVSLGNLTSDSNAWDGIAFYNVAGGGNGADISGVTFTGTNSITNNLQGGVFFEGDTDNNFGIHATPAYTVTGKNGNTIDLSSFAFGNDSPYDVINYQTANVNAVGATFDPGAITGNSMNASERSAEDAKIIDQLDVPSLGLVSYWNTPEVYSVTEPATNITQTDATLNGFNGNNAASGHSFWVSTSTFSTATPTLPSGVYSTVDLGVIPANTSTSAQLSSATGLPAVTADTTYYYVAWSNVNGTWEPGSILTVTTAPLRTDDSLSALSVDQGTLSPVFTSSTTSYTDNVSTTVASVNVIATTTDANATVSVNGSPATNGTATSIALPYGTSTISVAVLAQDGVTTQTYTMTFNRALSSDDSLSALSVDQGTLSPVFSTGVTAYTDVVPASVSNFDITATTTDPNATLNIAAIPTIDGTPVLASLAFGKTTTTITVIAQDGTVQYYTILVMRGSGTGDQLSGLTSSAGALSPAFATSTFNYTESVPASVTSTIVTPTAVNAGAALTVNGSSTTSGTPTLVALPYGTSTISFVVGSNPTFAQTYSILVTRGSAGTGDTLSSLDVDGNNVTPLIASTSSSYTESVATDVTSTVITPTLTDTNPNVTMTLNGDPITSGTSSTLPLAIGANTFTIVVTATDVNGGVHSKTYTVVVDRALSGDDTLSALDVSSGILAPAFDPTIASYNEVLPFGSTIAPIVTATTTDSNATDTITQATSTTGIATVAVTAQDGVTTQDYTVTFSVAAPTTAMLNISLAVDNSAGGSATSSDFTVNVLASNPSTSTFPGDPVGTSVIIDPNIAYNVNVSSVTNYTQSKNGDCNDVSGLPAGTSATCSITETFVVPPVSPVVSAGGGGTFSSGSTSGGGSTSGSGAGSGAGGSTSGSTGSTGQGEVLGASAFNFTVNLGLGSKSDDVTQLQNQLTSAGFYTGPITGYFGPLTLAAVKAYQKSNGLPVTGFVGPLTRAQLNSANNAQGTPGDAAGTVTIENQITALEAELAALEATLNASSTSQATSTY